MERLNKGLLVGLMLCLLAPAAQADAKKDRARREYYSMRQIALIEAGTEIAKVGTWCRKAGMTGAATKEFLKAVQVSEGHNSWANRIVSMMHTYGDAFWRGQLKRVSPGMIRAHVKRSKKAHRNYVLKRLKLAKWAHKKDLTQEALLEYEQLCDLQDEPLEKNAKGEFMIEGKTIPADYTKKLEERAVRVNDRWYPRSSGLLEVNVESIVEVMNQRVRVRMQTTMEEASDLHNCLNALYPHLEKELGGSPTRVLNAFVFEKKVDWDKWLDGNGLSRFKAATGLADAKLNTAALCAEGLDRKDIPGLLMHEFTHLFDYNTSRAIMPSWYREGLAETFGGAGTFTWDGKELVVKKMLDRDKLADLLGNGYIPLKELVESSAMDIINRDTEKAYNFYAESWALYNWLREHADGKIKTEFKMWLTVCRGKGVGAKDKDLRSYDQAQGVEMFRKYLGPHLADIETGFRAWLDQFKKE